MRYQDNGNSSDGGMRRGAFDLKWDTPVATAIIVLGSLVFILLVARLFTGTVVGR